MDWQKYRLLFEILKTQEQQIDIRLHRDEQDEEGMKMFVYDVNVEKERLILIHQDIMLLSDMGPMARTLYVDSGSGIEIIQDEAIIRGVFEALQDTEHKHWFWQPDYWTIIGKTKERLDQTVQYMFERLEEDGEK
jgi:hypothetical protein